ncbi:MAG: flavin reductase [Planctomycetia bacterium]
MENLPTYIRAGVICGVRSGREFDKVTACGFDLVMSERVSVPGIRQCIANVELVIQQKVVTGDHLLVVGEVLRFAVDTANLERCLLSVGPSHITSAWM